MAKACQCPPLGSETIGTWSEGELVVLTDEVRLKVHRKSCLPFSYQIFLFKLNSPVEGIVAKIQAILADPKNSEKLQVALGQQIATCLAVLLVRCIVEYATLMCPLSNGV